MIARAVSMALSLVPMASLGQMPSNDADWPAYNRDLAGTRYSPLADIDVDNVASLEPVWSYSLGRHPSSDTLTGGYQLTPLVIDGRMYVAGADHVAALDAATGEELWRFAMRQNLVPSRRGLAYWPGDDALGPTIALTAGQMLVRILPDDRASSLHALPVVYFGAPVVFENLLVIGSNSPPGSVRALDVRDGSEVWAFNSIPGPNEPGRDTWGAELDPSESRAFHWAFSFTIDVERELVFAAFESAGPSDYSGADRPGDNLYGDSIVALDVRTGERRWHYQTVHHDLWDFDLPAAPTLLDVDIDGERVPILAVAGKTGYLYVLNRETGEPVFGIEERAVPASNVPGEHSAPTQPIPLKPPPIAKVDFSPDDLVTAADTNEAHAEFCRRIYEQSGGFFNAGPFTPYMRRDAGAGIESTIVFPGSIGGANWGGMAADPSLGYFFVNVMNEGSFGWMQERSDLPGAYVRTSIHGPLSRFWSNETPPNTPGNVLGGGESAWPCNKPPWAELLAVDAATGDIVWQVPLGVTDELPAERRRTGRLGMGGPIVTAGGLVFIGATNDRRFRAFNARTGEELWTARLPMSAYAVPITYRAGDGKQYVAIVAAAASALDDPSPADAQRLIVFGLP